MAFPTVESATSANWTSDTDPQNIAFPSIGIEAGDLLIFIVGRDAAGTTDSVTDNSGDGSGLTWTELIDAQDANARMFGSVHYARAVGGEDGNTISHNSSGTQSGGGVLLVIRGSDPDTAPEVNTRLTGTVTTVTPGTLNPTNWDVEDTLWIPWCAWDGNRTVTYPYANNNVTGRHAAATGAGAAGCTTTSASASLTSSDYTLSGADDWIAGLIAVRPAPSGTNLTPAGLDHSRAIGTGPKVNPSLGPASLVHTRALGAPKVNVAIALSGLEHTRALGSPAVILLLKPVGLEHTRSIAPAPQVNTTIVMAGLDHGRALGSPQVTLLLGPSGLSHTRALGSPRVDPKLAPAGLDHGRTLGSPTVSGSSQVSPSGLEHTRALGSPTVFPNLFPASLVHTRALGAPFIPAMPASLVHTRALGSPHVDVVLTPAGLDHGRTLGTTGVTTSGSGPESIYDSGNYPYGYTH